MNQVSEGTVNIGNSDVALPTEFKDKGIVDHKVVVLPFVFITNKDVTVDNLTEQQAVDILTGKITNWKEVGGQDKACLLYTSFESCGGFNDCGKLFSFSFITCFISYFYRDDESAFWLECCKSWSCSKSDDSFYSWRFYSRWDDRSDSDSSRVGAAFI